MSESKQISASDFYNLFGSYYPVDLFSQEDIEELITFPSNRQGIAFSPEVQHAILRFGGRFPYFIQRACYYFFEAQLKGAINIEEVLQGSRRDAERLWLRYWDKLNMQQQRLLFSIASDFPVETSSTVEYLKDTALVYEEQGHLYPYSEEFGRFIRSREHSHMGFPVNQGDHLWGQYEVEDILGRTQHSQVVKARESYLEDYFAIKLPYVNQDLNEEQIAQILDLLTREAKILAHLEHKNIGKVHSVRLNPMGVIMPWIEGQPLDKVMEKRRPLKPVQVIEIGLQLADALRYAHAHGIIHRDIKPNNILLTSDDQLILIDFDVAHSEDQHTITSTNGTRVYVGNKNYGAPEQFDPVGQVEQAADLFALGMVLYELVTTSHQRPFTYGPNPKAYGGQLPPPERYAIPDPLYQILCPLLHQDPAQRLSADQLYEALQTCLKVLEGNDSHE